MQFAVSSYMRLLADETGNHVMLESVSSPLPLVGNKLSGAFFMQQCFWKLFPAIFPRLDNFQCMCVVCVRACVCAAVRVLLQTLAATDSATDSAVWAGSSCYYCWLPFSITGVVMP